MAIETTKPVTLTGIYDKVWFKEITIRANSVNADARVDVGFVLFAQGTPNVEAPGTYTRFQVNNLMALAQTDTDVAAAMQALFTALTKIATQRGLI